MSEMKGYDACIEAVDEFLPYVDNWAVCDIISPKTFKKNKTALLEKIKEYVGEERFAKGKFDLATKLFNELVFDENFEEFLTLKAYPFI